jgi:hypothetical protein
MFDVPVWAVILSLTTEKHPPMWMLAYAVAISTADPSTHPTVVKMVALAGISAGAALQTQ